MKNFKNLEIEDYLQIFWRRKWYFVVTFILVGTGAAEYARRQPQIYTSETKIMVQAGSVPDDYVRQVDRSTPLDRINAIRARVQSRTFLARIIEQFQLFGYGSLPGFSMEGPINGLRNSIKVDSSLGNNTFTLSYYDTDQRRARDVTKMLADALKQEMEGANKDATIETDQFVEEQLRGADRDLSVQEEKIKDYKTSHLGVLPDQSMANLNILTGLQTQLASVEGLIDRATEQQKLAEFRRQGQQRLGILNRNLFSDPVATKSGQPETATATGGAANTLEQQLALRRAQLAQLGLRLRPGHPDYDTLTREVRDLEQKVVAMNDAKKNAADAIATPLTPLGAQANAGSTGTSTRPGTDASVLPIDLESEEIRLEMESLKDELAKRERERGEILKQIKQAQGRLNLAPTIEQELMALARDREVLQRRYGDLQSKKFNSQMAKSLAIDVNNESYKIIDEANLPGQPSSNRVQIILVGLGASLFLGLAAVAGREYLDPTLGSEHEASLALNIPVLICIPEIADHGKARRKLLAKKAS